MNENPTPKPLPGAMPPLEKAGAAPEDFQPRAVALDVLRSVGTATLGTLDRNTGHPVTTLVTVALAVDRSPFLLLSRLSAHTANLAADGRASVLITTSGKGDPLAHPRLTVLGEFAKVTAENEREPLRTLFLARHPKATLYADFGDFAYWRMRVVSAHLNGGFARAADLSAADLLLDGAVSEDFAQLAASAIDHMNSDHRDAVQDLAQCAGCAPGRWRMVGLDPEGCDLKEDAQVARIAFAQRVATGKDIHQALKALLAAARR